MKKEKGFTLLELVVVIAIMGIITAMALPSYRNMQINTKIREAINSWQGSFHLAQAEAMRIKRDVILCPSSLGTKCNNDVGYEKGWIVTELKGYDKSGNPEYRILRDELPLEIPGLQMSFNTNSNELVFSKNGNVNKMLTLCVSIDKDGKKAAQRAVTVSFEGRIRISDDAQDLKKCSG